MKKTLSILLAALLLTAAALPALATEGADRAVTLDGQIEIRETLSLLAPFGGRLEDFSVQAGDVVAEGEALFSIATTKVYAAFDGTVRGVRAQAGDDALTVIERYGALAYLEPEAPFVVSATTSGAYKSSENANVNRLLHVGETVYLRSVSSNDRIGVGFITAVEGSAYTVEVTQSSLEIEEKVNLFRSPAFTTDSRIGTNGTVSKNPALAVTAEGSILFAHVSDGDTVKRGDLLFETVTGTLDGLLQSSSTVASPVSGVVVQTYYTPGTLVSKGDVLATLQDASALWVKADIDEGDLSRVQPGDSVRVTFDAADREPLSGTVESISSLSTSESGDGVYAAYISLSSTEGLRQGMRVTVTTQ